MTTDTAADEAGRRDAVAGSAALADGGVVVVAEEKVAETFTPPSLRVLPVEHEFWRFYELSR
jgi:hypothetical protein